MDDKKKALVTETRPQGLSEQSHGQDHEHSDIVIRPIFMAFIVLLGVTVLAMIATWGFFEFEESRYLSEQSDRSPVMDTMMIPPMPRLQVNEHRDLEHFRSAEDSLLHGTGVVDSAANVMRIPIDSAIEIVARRGIMRDQAATPAASGTDTTATQRAAEPSGATTK